MFNFAERDEEKKIGWNVNTKNNVHFGYGDNGKDNDKNKQEDPLFVIQKMNCKYSMYEVRLHKDLKEDRMDILC